MVANDGRVATKNPPRQIRSGPRRNDFVGRDSTGPTRFLVHFPQCAPNVRQNVVLGIMKFFVQRRVGV